MLHGAEAAADTCADVVELRVEEQGASTCVVEDEGEILGREPDVERQQDSPQLHDPVVALEQAVAVPGQVGDTISGAHAERLEGVRQPVAARAELAIRETLR